MYVQTHLRLPESDFGDGALACMFIFKNSQGDSGVQPGLTTNLSHFSGLFYLCCWILDLGGGSS